MDELFPRQKESKPVRPSDVETDNGRPMRDEESAELGVESPPAEADGARRTSWGRRVLLAFCWLSVAIPLAVSALNLVGPERWWVGEVNLYLPQMVWAAPGGMMLIITAVTAPRSLWIPALSVLWALGPVMGFCIPMPILSKAEGLPLRIMTYNMKGRWNPAAARDEILRE